MPFYKPRKTYSRVKVPRNVARKRRTWWTSYNVSWCEAVTVDAVNCVDGTQSLKLRFKVLDQAALESEFSDSARIKRVLGDFWFTGYLGNAPPGVESILASDYANTFEWFWGFRRAEINNAGQFLAVAPLENDFDFSEARWLKTKMGIHSPVFSQTLVNVPTHQISMPVGNVHTHVGGVEMCNHLASGTGDICIETDVNCEECDQPGYNVSGAIVGGQFGYQHMRPNWRSRRGVSLRENQELEWDVSMVFPYITPYMSNLPKVDWFGSMKCLIEY